MSEKYAFIEAEKAHHSISILCRVMQVSRAGFYDWRTRKPSRRALENARIVKEIEQIHIASNKRYGHRRITAALKMNQMIVGRHRVAKLMREYGITARWPRKFKATTDSSHDFAIAPNLLDRNFHADEINQVITGDITYVHTAQGWLYLAVLIDLFSRRVVGWAMSQNIDQELTKTALHMALSQRQLSSGFIHHTDRGSQYAAVKYQEMLTAAGAKISMSRKGDCWDNAVSESFFSTIKTECIYEKNYATRDEARSDILKYLLWYNARRLHSTLGYVSPIDFERAQLTAAQVA